MIFKVQTLDKIKYPTVSQYEYSNRLAMYASIICEQLQSLSLPKIIVSNSLIIYCQF